MIIFFKFHYYDLYSLYQMNKNLKDLDFALLKLLNDLKEHYWPRGRMVIQRIANPSIPVRFWAWPPKKCCFIFLKKVC